MTTLYNGDCLEIMKDIKDKSVDMILCDLPYGTTACKWDNIIPFEPLWKQYKRIIKDNGVIALFGSEPFSSLLRVSNIDMYRYDWIWEKEQGTNFMTVKTQPYKVHENISIFYLDKAEVTGRSSKFTQLRDYFNEQKKKTGLTNNQIKSILGNTMYSHYFTNGIQFTIPTEENYTRLQSTGCFNITYSEIKKLFDSIADDCVFTYNPQMKKAKAYSVIRNKKIEYNPITNNFMERTNTINKGERYPTTIIKFNRDCKERFHPTQKPVKLLEYLIKTYTNENELVLDNCMGSGSTGVACVNTNRNFIGIELDKNYFEIAKNRINSTLCST